MNITTILWVVIGVAAFVELARLYYRLHTLEKNFERLLTALERASKRANRNAA